MGIDNRVHAFFRPSLQPWAYTLLDTHFFRPPLQSNFCSIELDHDLLPADLVMPQQIERDRRALLERALREQAHRVRLDQPLREKVGQDLGHEVLLEEGVVLGD